MAKKKCPVNDRFREGFETGMKETAASLGGKGVVKRSGLHPVCHKKDGTSMAHLHSGLSAPSATGRLQNPVRYKSVPYCFPRASGLLTVSAYENRRMEHRRDALMLKPGRWKHLKERGEG